MTFTTDPPLISSLELIPDYQTVIAENAGGIETASTFEDLPPINPPQFAFVQNIEAYFNSQTQNGTRFDIATPTYKATVTINSQDSDPTGITFNNTGTKLYEIGKGSLAIYQSVLSTPFEISTATFDTSINAQAQGGNIHDILFNNDGTKLFELGRFTDGEIYEYTLSDPFEIETATFVNQYDTQGGNVSAFAWNDDGTKLYDAEFNPERINQLTLSTPFDISTASFDTSIGAADSTSPNGLVFNNTGTKMYESGNDGDVFQYNLTTPFDISTATVEATINSNGPDGLAWDRFGQRFYECNQGSGTITQNQVTTGGWKPIEI